MQISDIFYHHIQHGYDELYHLKVFLEKTWRNPVIFLDFNFVLYHQIIIMVYFCVKTDFFYIFILHFMEVLYQKDWKVTTIWKRALV